MALPEMINSINAWGATNIGYTWPFFWTMAKIVAVVLPLMGCVAYLTLWERKMIGFMHLRIGPNRVGPLGLLQPIADGIKLLMKEIILPANANKVLFLAAPVVMIMPATEAASWMALRTGFSDMGVTPLWSRGKGRGWGRRCRLRTPHTRRGAARCGSSPRSSGR